MKIPPFKEHNPPDNLGYWTNKKTGEKYGGQYISPLLIPNLKKVEIGFNSRYLLDIASEIENENLVMNLNDSVSPVLVQDKTDKHSYFVIMPMKI